MSIFSETMSKAISDYRFLLRRHLDQVKRMTKLQKLQLRSAETYDSDLALYETGRAIVADIKDNMMEMTSKKRQYYSYSGIAQFCDYLENYLDNYEVEGDQLVHRGQKASRALMKSIQLMALPRESLSEGVATEFMECNKTIAACGTKEQCDLQLQTLTRQQAANPGFYVRIVTHLESIIMGGEAIAI
jgi:hypothetical protein